MLYYNRKKMYHYITKQCINIYRNVCIDVQKAKRVIDERSSSSTCSFSLKVTSFFFSLNKSWCTEQLLDIFHIFSSIPTMNKYIKSSFLNVEFSDIYKFYPFLPIYNVRSEKKWALKLPMVLTEICEKCEMGLSHLI